MMILRVRAVRSTLSSMKFWRLHCEGLETQGEWHFNAQEQTKARMLDSLRYLNKMSVATTRTWIRRAAAVTSSLPVSVSWTWRHCRACPKRMHEIKKIRARKHQIMQTIFWKLDAYPGYYFTHAVLSPRLVLDSWASTSNLADVKHLTNDVEQ